MTGRPKPDVRLVLHTSKDSWLAGGTHYHAELHIQVVKDGKVTSPGHFYHDDLEFPTNAYEYLTVSASWSPEDGDPAGRWYGWQVRFRDVYDVDLDHALRMVKTLRMVKAFQDRHTREFGSAATFTQYATVVARALGATDDRPFGWRDPDYSYDGTGYVWRCGDGLQMHLDRVTSGHVKADRTDS